VIDTLGQNGRVSCVGRLAGEVPRFNTASLFFRRLRMGGVAVSTYGPGPSRTAWEKIAGLMAGAGCRPVVDEVFAFGRLKEAFARLAAGPMGKVLLAAGG
jgi:NADPH2:quinone reductase